MEQSPREQNRGRERIRRWDAVDSRVDDSRDKTGDVESVLKVRFDKEVGWLALAPARGNNQEVEHDPIEMVKAHRRAAGFERRT
jgi:hypothetical protein